MLATAAAAQASTMTAIPRVPQTAPAADVGLGGGTARSRRPGCHGRARRVFCRHGGAPPNSRVTGHPGGALPSAPTLTPTPTLTPLPTLGPDPSPPFSCLPRPHPPAVSPRRGWARRMKPRTDWTAWRRRSPPQPMRWSGSPNGTRWRSSTRSFSGMLSAPSPSPRLCLAMSLWLKTLWTSAGPRTCLGETSPRFLSNRWPRPRKGRRTRKRRRKKPKGKFQRRRERFLTASLERSPPGVCQLTKQVPFLPIFSCRHYHEETSSQVSELLWSILWLHACNRTFAYRRRRKRFIKRGRYMYTIYN